MNTEKYYIIDNPRPLSQDFPSLKNEGLSYIQECMDDDWSNLNPSDPGVTILDQLCYALTELGYCNDFPMVDILTGHDGTLQVSDQFYLPENILTSAPVTIDDLRKYIVDGVGGIDNLVIVPVGDDSSGIIGVYQLYLLIDNGITEKVEIDNVCSAAFIYANKARNLGEIFNFPVVPLARATRYLQGRLVISNEQQVVRILTAIQEAINNYIFPKVNSEGYDRLAEKNTPTDEIFNGPLLTKGWIQDNSLGTKKNKLRGTELTQVITSVAGVVSASNIIFTKQGTAGYMNLVRCEQTEILFIDLIGSLRPTNGVENTGILEIYCNGKQLSMDQLPTSLLSTYAAAESNILYGASVNNQTVLPKGKFRDINSYYSIQHTFPEIFRVGIDALVANASDFQIAQSRQLKGYLTLFDQVLANQFSQLAGIGQLFSFKNATSGAPSDKANFYAVRDAYEIAHPKYPVPFRDFSPTYFYQSLYKVPNIRPLIKNNDVFGFGIDPFKEDVVMANDSWIEFQRDPYNSYMKGLMNFMEDEKINLKRRNDILDHLLARHGESPLMIDIFIDGSLYAGVAFKDKVIFKSLYLQNLGLLSYYRQKAHNFMGASRISADIPEVTSDFEQRILGWDSTDFVIDSEKIDRAEKLKEQDFINYAGVELKLCLLFGLKALYKNFISGLFIEGQNDSAEIRTAMWMIEQRRGFIFLETSLLNYYILSAENTDPETEQTIKATLPANDLVFLFPSFIETFMSPAFASRLDFFLQNEMPVRLNCQYYFPDANQLQKIIPVFTDWHNCLAYNTPDHFFNKWLTKSAVALSESLSELLNVLTKKTK